MTVEEMSGPPFGVFSDNWLAARVFVMLDTQWRVGFGGPTGLDYGALPIVMRQCGVAPAERGEVFELVRVMERAALRKMGEKRR